MAHESYLYDNSDTELYQTNLYGGTDPDIDGTERFTDDIDLTVQLGAIIDFLFDGSDALNDLVINLYKRRDNSWSGDEIAVTSITVENDGNEHLYHFTIEESYGAGHYRFGMVRSGGATTFDIDVEMRTYRRTNTIA